MNRRCLLSLSKIAINTIYIWTIVPKLPVLKPNSWSFQYLPPTLQTILLHTREKLSYNRDPVSSGTASAKLLTDNLRAHICPDTSTFEDKATQWFCDLLLNKNDDLDNELVLTMVFLLPMACVPHVNSLCHTTNSLWSDWAPTNSPFSCDAHQTKHGNSRTPDWFSIVFYVIFFS